MNHRLPNLVYLLLLVMVGCTSTIPNHFQERPLEIKEAVLFLERLNQIIAEENVLNAIGNKVRGFPYLRTNRFFSYLKNNLNTDQEKLQWLSHLKNFEQNAKRSEIFNLSQKAIENLFKSLQLRDKPNRKSLLKYFKLYADQLYAHDQEKTDFYNTIISVVESPDEYSTSMRVFGLYPLAYGPVAFFTSRAYERMENWHQLTPDQLQITGQLIQYQPNVESTADTKTINDIFSTTEKDTLGIYNFSKVDLSKLLAYFAPVYIQDTVDANDIPGKVTWNNEQLTIDVQSPAVYYYFTYVLMNNKPAFQINYVNWYSAREGPRVPWYEEGLLDGFNYRVTLGTDGKVIMVDIVHNCGCYHFFVPRKELIKSKKPISFEFDALTPTWLPKEFPVYRIAIRTNSGWHQVENISFSREKKVSKKYQLIPYNKLESLPVGDDSNRSIFNSEGIVTNSERIEPYLLFSMGIPEIGAMRQRTHHPTKLLGREHFDNPLLLQNHFEFKE